MFSRIMLRENPSRRIRRIRIEGNCGSGYIEMTFRNSRNKRKRRLSSLGQVCELFSQPTLRQAGDFHTPRFSSLSGAESSTGERRYTLETFPFLQGFFYSGLSSVASFEAACSVSPSRRRMVSSASAIPTRLVAENSWTENGKGTPTSST